MSAFFVFPTWKIRPTFVILKKILMTLFEINEKYQTLYKKYKEESNKAIESASEKLIILLDSLKGEYPFPLIEEEYGFRSDNCWAINLRYISRIGIRYCGQFVNMIIISKNEQGPASERIRLTFASYEDGDDCLNECYPDDMYFGEDADCRYHEITIQNDWNNFWNLICTLCPFFENVGLAKEYEYSVSEILQDSEKLKDIEDQITTLILEDLEFYMREVFRRKDKSIKQLKNGIILLPNNLSIRFKGKFHNCLILDNYGFSLGYLQNKNNIAEECYYQDPYTIKDDFDRNQNRGYKLLHEVCFNPMNNGFSQVAMALRDLIFICGNDFEKLMAPSCRYVMSSCSTT